jgi:hypothetical protein
MHVDYCTKFVHLVPILELITNPCTEITISERSLVKGERSQHGKFTRYSQSYSVPLLATYDGQSKSNSQNSRERKSRAREGGTVCVCIFLRTLTINWLSVKEPGQLS